MVNKTKKEQQNELSVGIAGVTILLILLMVSIICGIGISSEINRESQVGAVSYVKQSEYLEGVEVSEREFQEIKGTQSNDQKSIKHVNERLLEYAILFYGLFIIVLFSYLLIFFHRNITD